jgi:hypothetical protein
MAPVIGLGRRETTLEISPDAAPIAYWRRPRHSAKRAELARALLATSDEISC